MTELPYLSELEKQRVYDMIRDSKAPLRADHPAIKYLQQCARDAGLPDLLPDENGRARFYEMTPSGRLYVAEAQYVPK
jgi:hypothetical protein